ncbi:MAG TPA: hypothetical protein VHS99_12335 [Chloroflexota bacterium]|nr:hypothetical protein [Chloroflexota bacterium]
MSPRADSRPPGDGEAGAGVTRRGALAGLTRLAALGALGAACAPGGTAPAGSAPPAGGLSGKIHFQNAGLPFPTTDWDDKSWTFDAMLDVARKLTKNPGTPPTTRAAMDVWYQRYEYLMPRAELEKVTQGAIAPRRTNESGDHVLIDWSKFSQYYTPNVTTPLLANQATAKDLLTRAKPGYDAIAKEIYETYKGRTPA